jgi:hypothetical protein
MNFQPIVDGLKTSLQSMRDELSKPVDVPVRIVGADGGPALDPRSLGDGRGTVTGGNGIPAPETGRIIPPQSTAFSLTPNPGRYGGGNAWDSPADYSGDSLDKLAIRAHEGWQKVQSGGAYHTLQEAGRFGRKWGTFLGDQDAGEQREWADAAGTPEGRKYADSMEETERIGKKIAALLKEIGQGGSSAVKAAEELKKAQEALDAVGAAGKKAADGLGGDMGRRLADELQTVVGKAKTDGVPDGGPRGKAAGIQDIFGMIRNPEGMLQRGALEALSGLSPAALAGLGLGSAVAGGVYMGYKFNDNRSDKGIQEFGREGDDVYLSNSLGRNFDFRKSYWNADRTGALEGHDTLTARSILGAMNVGLDTFKFNPHTTGDSMSGGPMDLTDKAKSFGYANGIHPEETGHLLGAAIESGAVGRSQGGAEGYFSQITGYLARMASAGVTTNASLSAIAALNGAQVQALGKLAPGAMNFNQNLLEEMAKTGDPALRGVEGAQREAQAMGHVSGEQVPVVFSWLLRHKDIMGNQAHAFGDADGTTKFSDWFKKQPAIIQSEEWARNPKWVDMTQRSYMASPEGRNLNPFLAHSMLGVGNTYGPWEIERMKHDPAFSPERLLQAPKGAPSPTLAEYNYRNALIEDQKNAEVGGESNSFLNDAKLSGVTREFVQSMAGFKGDVDRFSRAIDKVVAQAQMGQGGGSPSVGFDPMLPGVKAGAADYDRYSLKAPHS